jgi:hypothetical protein
MDGRTFTRTRPTELEETLEQDWPRCGGERIDPADAWVYAGFEDEQVVAWLEVGVYKAAAAVRLDLAGVAPRDVLREHNSGETLGLAFARGEVSLRRVLGREEARP